MTLEKDYSYKYDDDLDVSPTYKQYEKIQKEYISSLDVVAKAAYFRSDYKDDSQIWPDYLDYVEEWEWHAKELEAQLTSSVVFSYANRRQKIKCGGHYHVLSRQKDLSSGDTNVDIAYVYDKCWFITIKQKVEEVFALLKKGDLRLPLEVEIALVRIAGWRFTEEGQTPILLPFDGFKRIWWDQTGTGRQSEIAKNLLKQLSYKDQIKIIAEKEHCTPDVSNVEKSVLLHFPQSEHGLHALRDVLSQTDWISVLSWINRQRRELGCNEKLTDEKISRKILKCAFCIERERAGTQVPGLSPLGVYYAPPGLGKTTTMNLETFIGIDTDWIGVGLTWQSYSFILSKGIPIITNQPEAFIGCGLKIYGVLNNNVRLNAQGIPYTSVQQMLMFEKQHGRQVRFFVISDKQYMSDWIDHLKILNISQKMIANYAINMVPFYKNERTEEWSRVFPKMIRRELEDT